MLIHLLLLVAIRNQPVQPFSFAFFGCNRIDAKDYEAHKLDIPSSANPVQLKQNFDDILALELRPQFVFALGDLVNNYGDDNGELLDKQLEAWSKLLPDGITVVPVSGNHEMNRKHADAKLANPATTGVWNHWLIRHNYYPINPNGPKAGTENIADDQSRLSYSFTTEGQHFVVLNTDTRVTDKGVDGESKIAKIPVKWLENDLKSAEKDAFVQNIFVLGHRNLIDGRLAKGDAPVDAEDAKAALAIFKSSAKFRAYLCAHVHANEATQLPDSFGYQIIVGNGGSKLEKGWHPLGGEYFGFGVIQCLPDGAVQFLNYKRPVPTNYMEGPGVPAKLGEVLRIQKPQQVSIDVLTNPKSRH